nr:MAG TPA: hypothetical protein [Bacteriophage sp.]
MIYRFPSFHLFVVLTIHNLLVKLVGLTHQPYGFSRLF